MNSYARTLLRLIISMSLSFTAVAQHAEMIAKFDSLMSKQFKSNEPGATALIARNGQIIYKKGFGMANLELNVPMQVDNVFRIGSITKQFTGVAILQLMEQGKLSLQDEITKFIPDYPTQGNTITIEHLLTHTSGIRNYASMRDTAKRGTVDFTPLEMIDYFKNQPIRFAPGTKWEYSNSGYFLLGYIIEQVSGKTYGEYLEEHIFKPLGMTHSLYGSDIRIVHNRAGGYSKGDHGFENSAYLSMTQPYAAGSIQSTVEDLLKWNLGVHSHKLIKKESLEKALTRYTLSDGTKTKYGYGWRFGYIQESPSFWHGGWINGFITMAMYLPNEDVFVAVFSNCDCNSSEDITARLAAVAIGKPYEYKAISVENSILEQYTGVYQNDIGQQRIITVPENKLYAQLGRGPKQNVIAYRSDRFFFEEDAMQAMEFTRNQNGEVDTLITKSRSGNIAWTKTTLPIPSEDGIKVDGKILDQYVGTYEVSPEFVFAVTREHDRLWLQATGQDKLEMFAETEATFFLKVNDAQIAFVRDDAGNVTKAIVRQGGRTTDAKKIQ